MTGPDGYRVSDKPRGGHWLLPQIKSLLLAGVRQVGDVPGLPGMFARPAGCTMRVELCHPADMSHDRQGVVLQPVFA
jgi:hypothetical protein